MAPPTARRSARHALATSRSAGNKPVTGSSGRNTSIVGDLTDVRKKSVVLEPMTTRSSVLSEDRASLPKEPLQVFCFLFYFLTILSAHIHPSSRSGAVLQLSDQPKLS